MAGREKVIKGLECCLTLDSHCGDCPYYSCDTQELDCERNLRHDALALLKEQEAAYQVAEELLRKKTILFDELLAEQEAVEPDTDSEGTCSCGNCGETVGYFPAGCSTPQKLCKFCPECGKKVKWE